MGEAVPHGESLRKYQRIVIDMDICISCGACVAVCPVQALELDQNAKARLIWEKCIDDFSCVKVCPVNCIWPSSEAPQASKEKSGWYRFGRELEDLEKTIFEEWKGRYSISGAPAEL